MELLPKYLNELSDTSRNKRTSGYKRLFEISKGKNLSVTDEFEVLRSCLRGFEDTAERCREYAIMIVTLLLPRQESSVLDWVMPAVVTRIGISPVEEESEELRLLLLRLAVLCMDTFPHEIGPRNYIDFFQVLLENCMRDAFPELKKEACRACVRLCAVEPLQIKHISLQLSKVVKSHCLFHKHSVVRAESVITLASLIKHGASEILRDGKDEAEGKTTTNVLFVLANDHSESVRSAVVNLLSIVLLDIPDRQEQHRRLLPHLLLLVTDRFEVVSTKANEVLDSMGRLFLLDNEDNSIDITKRRITMKDIEWYGDDDYPDLTLTTVKRSLYPVLMRRPSLGARYVVAESFRGFVEKLFSDITAIDWVIPFSSNNKRVVALRILWLAIYYSEKSVVQLAEHILGALYKSMRDDNQDVTHESLICVEILSKYLTPDQYLPFLIVEQKPKKEDGEEADDSENSCVVVRSATKTVVLSSFSAATIPSTLPTLFSTAALSVKCSILTALRFLLDGSKHLLTTSHALQVVKALTSTEILDSDDETLLCSLLSTMSKLIHILGERNFIPTPEKPLPKEVLLDYNQRTLDSVILYALLCMRSSAFISVQDGVSRCIRDLSITVTGEEKEIYNIHLGRLLYRYGSQMPVKGFSDLLLNSDRIEDVAEQMADVFLSRLSSVDYTKSVTEELHYFRLLEQLLWRKAILFPTCHLEDLLRAIILPKSAFHPGGPAHLFRKIAIGCLCAVLQDQNRLLLHASLADNEFALLSKVVTLWCSATDADDAEMRLLCLTAAPDISRLPLNVGSANDVLQSILLRLDDSSDVLRLKAAEGLQRILLDKDVVSPILIDEIISQIVPTVKRILIHLDDSEEMVGLRTVLVSSLKEIAVLSPSVVSDIVRGALSRQENPSYCQEVLLYIDSM